jgi:hypothetical protein
MKKLILAVAFVFATGTMMNANSSNDEVLSINSETIEIVEEFGCASACAGWAKSLTLAIAQDIGEDPNSDDMYMAIYKRYYTGCLAGC